MDRWIVALRLIGLGWYIGACIVIGILGGVGLDKLTGTTPLFTIIGTVGGSVMAFWGMYRMIHPILYGTSQKVNQDKNRRDS